MRRKLAAIKKNGLTQDEIRLWKQQAQTTGWPKEVKERLQKLIEMK